MKISLLVDHEKSQPLASQTKFVLCESGEYFQSFACFFWDEWLVIEGTDWYWIGQFGKTCLQLPPEEDPLGSK